MQNPFDIGTALTKGWETFTANAASLIVGLILVIILSMVTLGLAAPGLLVGYQKMCLRAVRGETPEIGDVFEGFQFFLPALIVAIVVGIAVSLGFILLIIPGLILAMLWAWVFWLMADGKEGLGDLLQESGEITKGDWVGVFVLMLVVGIVGMIGGVVPFGSLVTTPITYCAMAHAYDTWQKNNAGAASSEG